MQENATPSTPTIGTGLRFILISNILFFLLQNVSSLWFSSLDFTSLFDLNIQSLYNGQLWRLFTYAFLHASIFHILFNMLGIFFIGQFLEAFLGTKKFLSLYFASILLGGLLWLLIKFNAHYALLGASAGAMGLIAFFCLLRPNQPITLLLFFVLPINLKPKVFFWSLLIIELFSLIFYELPGKTDIASSAHLGGILGGILAFQYFIHGTLLPKITKIQQSPPKWSKPNNSINKSSSTIYLPPSEKQKIKKKIDEILDKINLHGFGSLSNEEKLILDQAKNLLNSNDNHN